MRTKLLLLSVFAVLLLSYDVPKGWYKAGSDPDKYDMGIDKGSGRGASDAATIKSTKNKIIGFGTLMQSIRPDKYRGKRVRLTGYVKSAGVYGWAGVWMRVDGKESNMQYYSSSHHSKSVARKATLAFDNMGTRPIKGTTDWTKYEVVLNVADTATNISYGVLLAGTGQIWFDDMNFEIVGNDVQTTDKEDEPTNLNFEK